MSRRPPRSKTPNQQSAFADALSFVALAQRDIGSPYQTHVIIENQTIIGFDGVLTAGIKIEEDLNACPHCYRLLDALKRSGENYTIVQTTADKLTIKADKFNAFVTCVPRNIMPPAFPDPPICPINDELKRGLEIVSPLASENATRIYLASVLVRANSCVGLNGQIMFEFWHGLDLPTMALPKAAAVAIMKCNKELAMFGYSGDSATFYFADGSWIKTQLFTEQWPDIDNVFNVSATPWAVPPGFFDGVRAVAPFNDSGEVRFDLNVLRSHSENDLGATYDCFGIPAGPVFSSKLLLMAEPHIQKIDFRTSDIGKAFFLGDRIRGIIMGKG